MGRCFTGYARTGARIIRVVTLGESGIALNDRHT